MRSPILGLGCAILVVFTGCTCNSIPTPARVTAPAKAKATPPSHNSHEHQAGAHSGQIVPLGDQYHAEAVFEKDGTLRLFTLGSDETLVKEIIEQTLEGHVKLVGSSQWVPLALKPTPQAGDAKGKTSQFAGRVPPEFVGQHIVVKFATVRIGQERYRVAFEFGSHGVSEPHREDHMPLPMKVTQTEEQKLYLTPGGKYTLADIQANGAVVASAKFKGRKAEHDLKPKAGDKICPITLTKANTQFSWIIDGKNYEFCCPPCVDEFVGLAKEKPSEVQAPEAYLQK
jgi:YHS domain-containing protein